MSPVGPLSYQWTRYSGSLYASWICQRYRLILCSNMRSMTYYLLSSRLLAFPSSVVPFLETLVVPLPELCCFVDLNRSTGNLQQSYFGLAALLRDFLLSRPVSGGFSVGCLSIIASQLTFCCFLAPFGASISLYICRRLSYSLIVLLETISVSFIGWGSIIR